MQAIYLPSKLEKLEIYQNSKGRKINFFSWASGFTIPEFTITLGKHLKANIERGGSPEITDASIKIEDIYLNLQIALNKAEHVAVDQLGQHGANTLKAQKQEQTIKAGGSKYLQLENMFSKKKALELEINNKKSLLKSKDKEKIEVEMANHLPKTFCSDWNVLSESEVSNLLLADNFNAPLLLSVAKHEAKARYNH